MKNYHISVSDSQTAGMVTVNVTQSETIEVKAPDAEEVVNKIIAAARLQQPATVQR